MRLLVTIPHFCRRTPGEPGFYGSESGDLDARRAQVERCILALHHTFSTRQAVTSHGEPIPANGNLDIELHIAVVTSYDQHLVAELPGYLFAHIPLEIDPRHLGFACHDLMRSHVANYDYFAFLEDDIEITDALFFEKLRWFSQTFGNSALLQPNRYETADNLEIMKLYVDGETTRPELPARYQDITRRTRLIGEVLGRSFLFKRLSNVHSGCFFLNAAQLSRVAASPQFGKPTDELFSPLESAATLMIMRAFEVYKPARANAAFLEVRHVGHRFLKLREAEPEAAPAAETHTDPVTALAP